MAEKSRYVTAGITGCTSEIADSNNTILYWEYYVLFSGAHEQTVCVLYFQTGTVQLTAKSSACHNLRRGALLSAYRTCGACGTGHRTELSTGCGNRRAVRHLV